MNPTADDVAHAIVAAARETGADPISVVTGQLGNQRGQEKSWAIARARNYAGWALRKTFGNYPTVILARMVGVSRTSATAFWGNIDFNLRNNKYKWWNAAAFDRVVAAIKRSMEGHPVLAAPSADVRQPPQLSAAQTVLSPLTAAEVKDLPSELPTELRGPAVKAESAKRIVNPILRQRDLGEMVFRRKPSKTFVDMTAELCGDPPPARSALAGRDIPQKRQTFLHSSSRIHDEDDAWMRRRKVTLAEIGDHVAEFADGIKD